MGTELIWWENGKRMEMEWTAVTGHRNGTQAEQKGIALKKMHARPALDESFNHEIQLHLKSGHVI
jgi:hypothetical protein